jgi:2-polyprenyl-3-methyl-5-hydroxy-6-metoxy-1,4-benzoquinol methylase
MTEPHPGLRTSPTTSCPGCGGRSVRMITLGAHQLKKCRGCGLVYAPEFAEPDDIYVDGYFSGEVGNFGLDVRYPEFDEFLDFVAGSRMDFIERIVPRPGRILDVGCGDGHTLAEAQRRGWECVGVDLVADAVENAVTRYGLDVRNVLLEESGLPERSFDVVATTHVLEHQLDGAGFLTSIARWVKPGGYLMVEVPNWGSTDRWANRDRWFGLRPLEHLGHYSPRTLARTMRRIGAEPVAVATPCYQFPKRQSIGQALHDLGLERIAPYVQGDRFTVPETRRDHVVRLPAPATGRVLHAMESALNRVRAGTVVVMMARVP